MQEYLLKSKELCNFHNPELAKMCKACDNYGKFYSCPPLDVDAFAMLMQKDIVHIFVENAQDLTERKQKQLSMDSELKERFDIVFSAGKCVKCERCKRELGEPCEDFLYSAECLCLDMSKLYEHIKNEPLDMSGFSLIYIAG